MIELTVANIIDPAFENNVLPENIKDLISRMKYFLNDNPREPYCIPAFIGGENLAVGVIRTKKHKREIMIPLITPTILSHKELIASEERQYGIEGVYLVQRSPKILYAGIHANDLLPTQSEVIGKTALTVQQLSDALRGVSIDILGVRIDDFPEYQNGSAEDKNEIFKAMVDELKERRDFLKSEETEQYLKATAFVAEKIERSVIIESAVKKA